MGKQIDAIQLIRTAFQKYDDLEAIDLDHHPDDAERLKVSFFKEKGKPFNGPESLKFEDDLFAVYSGERQISKLATQRFTRDDI
jgi:hypothetical protein